jgi:flagellar basal body P-ring formation protein FlgA
MIRIAASLILALVLAAAPAAAQSLRSAVTVSGSTIRLGDLFAGAGPQADAPVSPAPAPGMRVSLDADWLAAVAREHHLAWRPGSGYDQVMVERASRVIGSDAIAERLMSAIAERESVADATLELDNPGLRLVVADDGKDAIAVDGLVIDRQSGRVSAFVSAPAGDPTAAHRRVTGRLIFRLDVPVLSHPVAPGATIAAADLATLKLRRDRLPATVATDAQQLIGKTPRRPLAADTPVRLADLVLPLLVHKGELVTIVFATSRLQLTAQGKALEDGARDALIRVANTKSNRVIDAAVAGAGLVRIAAPGAPPQLAAER